MSKYDILPEEWYYHVRLGKRVKVLWIDLSSGYAKVEDKDGRTFDTLLSNLEEIVDDQDMDADDILRREG